MEPLHPIYDHYLELLDIAFQPIVDIHTGSMFAVEALLRGTDEIGFESISSFFDHLYQDNILYSFDLKLRQKVLKKFCTIEGYEKLKLFYNIDNRLLEMSDFSKGNTNPMLGAVGLDRRNLVFELSEQNEILNFDHFTSLMDHYRDEGYCIALDDFGTGFSGYKLLYHSTPNIIKIDRFFLSGIDADSKKRLMVNHMVQLATLIGCRVIAEGVETLQEFHVCKELGCHMIQGYLIQRPTLNVDELQNQYAIVTQEESDDKRNKTNRILLLKRIEAIEPIIVGESMEVLFDRLKNDNDHMLVPIVDSNGQPMGVIRENRLKSIIYSPFGRSLVQNRSLNLSTLQTYMESIPVVDVTMPLDMIVEMFSVSPDISGVLVTSGVTYVGYLSARVLIDVVHEHNVLRARDQNPLTKLPGNFMINEYIANAFRSNQECVVCYFDFDHFKPFNDYYGFRNGDRAIILFADLMRKLVSQEYFKGHIGGDDFFLGAMVEENHSADEVIKGIQKLIGQFREEVRDFYGPEEKKQGYILAEDRFGTERKFDLMSVSAVVVHLRPGHKLHSPDALNEIFSAEKKKAKKSDEHFYLVTV